jgi:hypothetical protein
VQFVNWVTIYDVRNGWGVWIAGASAVAVMALWFVMLLGSVRIFRTTTDPSLKRKQIVGACVFFVSTGPAMAVSLWVVISDYRLRSDLTSEHFMETEGSIQDAHIEPGGRSNPMYFRVGERWFALPYDHPQDCYPRDGEAIRIVFEASANHVHRGPPAHDILIMQLLHGCRIPVWG